MEIECEKTICALCGADNFYIEARGFDYEYWTSEQAYCFTRCDDCGHVYLNPRPVERCMGMIYPPNYYSVSGRHRQSAIVGFMKKMVIRRRLSSLKILFGKGANILEIGCGDCSLLIDIKNRYPEATVAGIDIRFSNDAQEICHSMGIQLTRGSIEHIPLKEDSLDIVIMNQLLEHVRDPVGVIRKTAAALKPGGMLSIETPDVNGYERRVFKESFWGGYHFPRHLHLFSASLLVDLIERNDLQVVKQYSLVAPIHWILSFYAVFHRTPIVNSPSDQHSIFSLSDRNPLALAVFTGVDLVALALGRRTSNQKIIARKKAV